MVSKTRSGIIYGTEKPRDRDNKFRDPEPDFVWNPQRVRECEACGEVVDDYTHLRRCRICGEKICKKCRKKIRVPAVRYRLGVLDRETGEYEEVPMQTYVWDDQCNRFHHYPKKVNPIVLGTYDRPYFPYC